MSCRFGSVFPSLNMAVKRREQALQDYRRLQAKVEKYEEKEKTGPVLAKLHQVPRRRRAGGGQRATWLHLASFSTWVPTLGLCGQGTRRPDTPQQGHWISQ